MLSFANNKHSYFSRKERVHISIASQNVDLLTSQLVLKVGHQKTGTSEWLFPDGILLMIEKYLPRSPALCRAGRLPRLQFNFCRLKPKWQISHTGPLSVCISRAPARVPVWVFSDVWCHRIAVCTQNDWQPGKRRRNPSIDYRWNKLVAAADLS